MRLRYTAIEAEHQNQNGHSAPIDPAHQILNELPNPIWLPRSLVVRDVRTIKNHTINKIQTLSDSEKARKRLDDMQVLGNWFLSEKISDSKRAEISEKLGYSSSQEKVSTLTIMELFLPII